MACLAVTACGEPPVTSGGLLRDGKSLYSQFDEELIIRDFFQDRRNGFFVDVGAYHWKDASTTYYLERHLGWSGIAIDAFEQYGVGYRKNRPRSRFFSYIVTDHSGTKETLYLAGPMSSVNEDHVPGALAILRDPEARDALHDWDILDERYASELRKALTDASAVKEVPRREIEVETITLNELLDRNGVGKIDFLSMDIEGAEPKALAGFDIERFRPELVCIEMTVGIQEEISNYFEAHGYERIRAYAEYDAVNWYFRPASLETPEY